MFGIVTDIGAVVPAAPAFILDAGHDLDHQRLTVERGRFRVARRFAQRSQPGVGNNQEESQFVLDPP